MLTMLDLNSFGTVLFVAMVMLEKKEDWDTFVPPMTIAR